MTIHYARPTKYTFLSHACAAVRRRCSISAFRTSPRRDTSRCNATYLHELTRLPFPRGKSTSPTTLLMQPLSASPAHYCRRTPYSGCLDATLAALCNSAYIKIDSQYAMHGPGMFSRGVHRRSLLSRTMLERMHPSNDTSIHSAVSERKLSACMTRRLPRLVPSSIYCGSRALCGKYSA